MMNYRRMGRTGLKISEIALGAWVTFGDQIEEETASDLIHLAYEQGVNYFDNADIYAKGRAEQVMGKAIKDLPRESLVISSKVFWKTMDGPNGRGLSRKHITESINASLKRLGTEYLDLYFCHRYDPDTPMEEIVRVMDDLVHQGKILYWGTSEWRAAQIANAHKIARQWNLYPPMVEQPHYNMLVRRRLEDELVPAADDLGFGMVSWSPLEFGLLSGKYNQGVPKSSRLGRDQAWADEVLTESRLAKVRELSSIADRLGVSMAQLAIGWLLRVPQLTSVITGATKPSQLKQNLQAPNVLDKLNGDILEEIESVLGKAAGEADQT
ncbi:MAG: aldo/keto reductase [Anaerolineales bacterium]|jgi:voltage-dependent potassium channel beta subunit